MPSPFRVRRLRGPLSDTDPHSGNEDTTIVDVGPSEPTAITPVTFELPPTHEEIAAEAYAIYESRGGDHGGHEDDWREAERRLEARRAEDAGKK